MLGVVVGNVKCIIIINHEGRSGMLMGDEEGEEGAMRELVHQHG
jgi:hypothetical protein